MDVHINRSPVGGRVTRIEYRPGKFLPAYNGSVERQRAERDLDRARRPHGRLPAGRRHAGAPHRLPRRRKGDELERGERIGLMKFGSRMDVFLPPDAELRVAVGQQRRRRRDHPARVAAGAAGAAITCRCGGGGRIGRSASGAACSSCRRCSPSPTCSAATRCVVYATRGDFDTAALLHRHRDGARHARRLLRAADQLVDRRSACSSTRWPTWSRSAWRRRSWRSRGACGR